MRFRQLGRDSKRCTEEELRGRNCSWTHMHASCGGVKEIEIHVKSAADTWEGLHRRPLLECEEVKLHETEEDDEGAGS